MQDLQELHMKFQANVESLTVLVAEDRYCRFINGLYETNDVEEIKALQRAKGVRQIEKNSEQFVRVSKKI